jgi:hypothetical protein
MRIFTSFLFCILICGCSYLNGPKQFDNVEYELINKVTVSTTRAIHLCNDVDKQINYSTYVQQANLDTMLFVEYESNRSDSLALKQMAFNLQAMVNDVLIRGKYTPIYCIHKLSNIQASARIIERTLGETDQHSMCSASIKTRYDMFLKSYGDNDITKSEFQELSKDMVRLKEIDTTGCTLTDKQKQLEDIEFVEKSLSLITSL